MYPNENICTIPNYNRKAVGLLKAVEKQFHSTLILESKLTLFYNIVIDNKSFVIPVAGQSLINAFNLPCRSEKTDSRQ